MDKKRISPWWFLVAIVAIFGIIGVQQYNGLAKKSQAVDSAWAQVENVMQRRYDLVPQLVNAVKGDMKQEQKVFGAITDARKAYSSANTTSEKIAANSKMQQSVGTLVNAITENYPTLKSSESVQTLMTQLEGTENRISVERRRYNESVQAYNQDVVSFPKNIFANMTGMGKKPYFKADNGASTAPKVDLDTDDSSSFESGK